MKRLLTMMMLCLLVVKVAAQRFDNLPDPIEDVNKVVDNTPDSIAKALMSRPAPGSTRQGTNPVLFLVGNSTMRNGTRGDGSNGQWGWGYYANKYFDAKKITVENQALGGMSTRTFYTDLWPAVRDALKPGDWVIVSIGHNDNGEFFDKKRARAVIPGVDPDTCYIGYNERTHRQDTVYSYGHYLRCYIKEIRDHGANAILMSLTPRDAYDKKTGKIVRKPQTEWAAYVAATEGVPFVDLNELSGRKLDSYSPWKEKYHFLGDHIHTSKFGAEMNARSAAEGIWYSNAPQLRPLQEMMQNVPLPKKEVKREVGKPVVFFTGDSTVKNADKDDEGMWGWASLANTVFDESKITLCNAARAGRSTRSFLREGLWDEVYNSLQPGDFVTIQFGHNDICPITDKKARGVIPSTNLFEGVTTDTPFTDSEIYVLAGSENDKANPIFKLYDSGSSSGVTLSAYKSYLLASNVPSLASSLTFGFYDDETTGITDVKINTENGTTQYYDLSGRRVTHPTKGLYIVNGKKVIIK